MKGIISTVTASLFFFALVAASPTSHQDTIVVDLGYERYKPTFNSTGRYYNYSDIRYAAPPLGNLRFAPPHRPAQNHAKVLTGGEGRMCPQASPSWGSIATTFVSDYLQGIPFNESVVPANASSGPPPQDPRVTEDCLFLDVAVPENVYRKRRSGSGAPVLVWIYGGGYVAGSKGEINGGNPAGLLHRADDEIVYVAINYRLGAFGWLSGPEFQSNGTANVGLWDQRFALEWVQRFIHLFGGDPSKVTIMGESAGGGSIMHQITAFGGNNGPVPFQQAIPQSPGWMPVTSTKIQNQILDDFLSLLNVDTIQEARELPSETLIAANAQQVWNADYGQYVYGPTVGGDFVPALPGVLLLNGQYHKGLRIMAGHNSNEGLDFTSPYIQNNSAYRQYLEQSAPDATADVIDYIMNVLYPDVLDGTHLYTDETQRLSLSIAEEVFTCNTHYVAAAFADNSSSYSYRFDILPALHGMDVDYTFYNDEGPKLDSYGVPINVTVALTLQEFITSFVKTGVPIAVGIEGIPTFAPYGADANIIALNTSGITAQKDDAANPNCAWWQQGLYA